MIFGVNVLKLDLLRYWSLYLQFFEDFKQLNYYGILIPTLFNFSELIKDNVVLQEEKLKKKSL